MRESGADQRKRIRAIVEPNGTGLLADTEPAVWARVLSVLDLDTRRSLSAECHSIMGHTTGSPRGVVVRLKPLK